MPDFMRVCMISTHATRGGAAKMAATLVTALNSAELGVRATLYHCGDNLAAGNIVGLKRPWSRHINAALARLGGDKLIWDFGVARQLTTLARDFDVIHLHNLHGYYLDYQRLLDGIGDRPIVWTWHDMWPLTGRCGFSMGCEKWQTGCVRCPNLGYYPAAWIDWAARDFKARSRHLVACANLSIVAPSRWLADLGSARGYPAARLAVIPNPVDLGNFAPRTKSEARMRLGLPNQAPLLLFVAANCDDPRKGLDDFCAVASQLDVHGIVVGRSSRRPTGQIDFVGLVPSQTKLADFYCAADALVVPSSSDNYPNTTIEAQACGTPVFAYRIGGLPEQVPPFWSGVAEPHDVDGLAKLVLGFLSSGGKTDSLSSRIREHAVATWSPDAVAARYQAIYARARGREVTGSRHQHTGAEKA